MKTIPPYGMDNAETTVLAENLYPVNYVASAEQNVGIIVRKNFYPYSTLDWSNFAWIDAPAHPVQLILPLFLYTNPIIAGDMQWYGYVLACKSWEDGYYNIYYTMNGKLIGGQPDVLYVYKGTVNSFPRIALVQL